MTTGAFLRQGERPILGRTGCFGICLYPGQVPGLDGGGLGKTRYRDVVIKEYAMKEKRNRAEIVERCVELWEASVRATHDFLVEGDIEFYRPFVRENCEKLPLLLHYEGDEIVAFLGYDMTSIEMLFVDRITGERASVVILSSGRSRMFTRRRWP